MASRRPRPRYRRRPAEPHEVAEIAVEAFLAATTTPATPRRPPFDVIILAAILVALLVGAAQA